MPTSLVELLVALSVLLSVHGLNGALEVCDRIGIESPPCIWSRRYRLRGYEVRLKLQCPAKDQFDAGKMTSKTPMEHLYDLMFWYN